MDFFGKMDLYLDLYVRDFFFSFLCIFAPVWHHFCAEMARDAAKNPSDATQAMLQPIVRRSPI